MDRSRQTPAGSDTPRRKRRDGSCHAGYLLPRGVTVCCLWTAGTRTRGIALGHNPFYGTDSLASDRPRRTHSRSRSGLVRERQGEPADGITLVRKAYEIYKVEAEGSPPPITRGLAYVSPNGPLYAIAAIALSLAAPDVSSRYSDGCNAGQPYSLQAKAGLALGKLEVQVNRDLVEGERLMKEAIYFYEVLRYSQRLPLPVPHQWDSIRF